MKHLILILFLVLFNADLFAQAPDTLWTKTFGGSGYEYGNSVQQTIDGGYIIVGPGLIKTDANGDTLWTKTFDGSTNSVQQTTDGGYIITGSTRSFGAVDEDVWLIKTDTNGDTLWTKTFGGSEYDFGNSVQKTTDGGYIITGSTRSFGAVDEDVWLIKTDTNGDTLWTKVFGGDSLWADVGYSVQQTTDGGYIITGIINSTFGGITGWGISDVWLIKTDANGDTLWTKTFGNNLGDMGYSVQQTNDGGYIIAGCTGVIVWGHPSAVWLIKTDTNGDTLWTKTFWESGYNWGIFVQQTTDGGYVIVGGTESYGAGGRDVLLIKTDANGDTLWTNTFGGSDYDHGNSVQQTSDGGYVIVGSTHSFGAGYSDVWLIRLAPDVTAIDETPQALINDYRLQQNYPNPFNPTTTINWQLAEASDVTLKVYDVLGREVATLVNEFKPAGRYKTEYNAAALPSGIYFYQLRVGSPSAGSGQSFVEAKKMILVK